MPVIRNAYFVPIELGERAKPEPTALRRTPATHASGLTEQQKKICAELGISPEQFRAAQRGELPGARRA